MEKDKKAILNRSAVNWIWNASKGTRRYVAFQLMVQALTGLVSIGYSLLFRLLIDRAAAQNAPGFWLALGSLAGLTVLQLILRALGRWLDEFCSARLENRFRGRLFAALLRKDYARVTAVHTGEWMNRLTSDTAIVAKGAAQIIPNVCGMLVKMVGAFSAIVILQPLFGALVIPAGCVLILAIRLMRPLLKRLHSRVQETDGQVRSVLQEHLENLLIISAYSRQESSDHLAAQRMEVHRKARMGRSHVSNVSQAGFAFAIHAMYLSAAGICAFGIMNGTVSYGTMTAMLQLISHLQSPFYGLGSYLTQWYGMLSSAERLMEAENLPEDSMASTTDRPTEFEVIRGENVRFSYENGDECIRYRDFAIRKQEFIALTGPSGSGKSTLMKLLLCLYRPESGTLKLVTAEGARQLNTGDRRIFAYVPQGNQLMSGTIREIVAFYDEEKMKNEAQLWDALRVSCAEEFVSQLPAGLDTVLGEHGEGLSEGQMQRLAVARAVFSGRPVLLLDEATSALDGDTEARLLQNLRQLKDRTVLIITHRPKALEICDRVISMDED